MENKKKEDIDWESLLEDEGIYLIIEHGYDDDAELML